MKNLIELPTQNIYDVKSQEFQKSKLAKRLKDKYTPKPFEESYNPVYWIAQMASYFCNLFSIFTASTFVFTYFFSILKELPSPMLWAALFTGVILLLIEALQRILAPKLFKNTLQFGFKKSSFVLIGIIITLSSFSILFSYNGGFDVVEQLAKAPNYEAPSLKDVEAIKGEYKALILSASNDAQKWKKAKEWRGRLSDTNAKVYHKLLDKKATLQVEMIAKTNDTETKNEVILQASKLEHKEAIAKHENNLQAKGGGLSKFTIIAQILFFICIFFIEFYDYKTASQYALLVASEDISHSFTSHTIPSQNGSSNTVRNDATNRNQIGFKTDNPKQVKPLLGQKKTHIKTILIQDKNTIEHKSKFYTLADVNNFISVYEKRVREAKTKGKETIAANRMKTLKYWKKRKEELMKKRIDL